MKIVFFEVMPGEQEALSLHLPPGQDVVFLPDKLDEHTASKAADADVVSVFVKSEVRKAAIDQLASVKLITTRSMGFDHIDTEYAKSKGILVNNVQTYASHPVAEFTFALLLAVTRKIYPANRRLRENTDYDIRGLGGFNLYGKKLGVIGTGRIGKNVITIAKGFGMEIVAYDVMPDQAFAAEHEFAYVTLDEVAASADIVTVHAPYTKDTHHLVNAGLFAKMKKGVIFINTARGEIVDTHALIAALRDGTIWGAGVDVLEEERNLKEAAAVITEKKSDVDYELLTANHVLIDMPNVIVTPHIAFETAEAMAEITRVTAETISNFIAGKDQKYL